MILDNLFPLMVFAYVVERLYTNFFKTYKNDGNETKRLFKYQVFAARYAKNNVHQVILKPLKDKEYLWEKNL